MMLRIGQCSFPDCKYHGPFANSTRSLCPYHNKKRLEAARAIRPDKLLKHQYKIRRVKKLPHQDRRRKIRKPTGEKAVFFKIWNERPHVCTNCKIPLGDEACTFHFAHILSKKQRPDLRLVESNITILCFDCHQQYDQGTKESYSQRTRM